MEFSAIVTLAVFLFILVFCSLSKAPMVVIAVVSVITLILTDVLTAKEAFSGFSDPNVILVVCMYVLSAALLKTHLTSHLSNFLKKSRGSTTFVIFMCTVVNVIAFQFVNGIAVAALLLPIEMSLAKDEEIDVSLPQMLLPTFIAGMVSMGWLPLPKGLQKVAQYNAFLERMGFEERISMWSYTVVQIPMIIGTILVVVFLVYKWMPKETTIDTDRMAVIEAKASKGAKNELLSGWRENMCYIICALTIVGMLAADVFNTDIELYLISMIGAVLLIVTGLVTEKEAIQGINWSTIIIVGCFMSLGIAVVNSGVAELASNFLVAIFGSIQNKNLLMFIIWLFPMTATQFMSDAVTSAAFTPLVAAAAPSLGLNPAGVMIAMDFACNKVDMLPTGSASTLLVYGVGGYRPKHIFLVGLIPAILSALTVAFFLPIFYS